MIFDKQAQFSAGKLAAEFVRTAGTVVVGDVIDLWNGNSASPNAALPQGVNGPIGGPGAALTGRLDEIEVYVQCTETFTSGGAATVQLKLIAADDAALTTNPVIMAETPPTVAYTDAAFIQGAVSKLSGDIGNLGNKRYLGLQIIIATATLTAGMIASGIVADFQTLH
jgi:hypothetical protein